MLESVAALARAILAGCFLWAAASKLLGVERWLHAVERYPLSDRLQVVTALAVPPLELGLASLLAFGDGPAGGIAALVALSAFSIAVLAVARTGRKTMPCGCFGGRRAIHHRIVLARNAVLALLALAATGAGGLGEARVVAAPRGAEVAAAALTLTAIALVAWLLRQTGDLWRGR